jgi:hypothetical protein
MPHKPTGRKPGRPRKQVLIPDLGEKPDLTPRQWKALAVEYQTVDWAREPWPSRVPLRGVASAAEVSHEAVRKWRLDPLYQRGLIWLAHEELSAALEQESQQPRNLRTKRQADALLHVHLKANWQGPTVSPLDGKTYDNADDYFRHVQNHPAAVWVGDLPPGKSK